MVEGYVKIRSLSALKARLDGWIHQGDVWIKEGYGSAKHNEAALELMEKFDPSGYEDWLKTVKEEHDWETDAETRQDARDELITFAWNHETAKELAPLVAMKHGWVRLDDTSDASFDIAVQGTQSAILENLDKILIWIDKESDPGTVLPKSIRIEIVHPNEYRILEYRVFSEVESASDYLFSLQDRTILGVGVRRRGSFIEPDWDEAIEGHPFNQRRDGRRVRVHSHRRRSR